MQPQAHAGSRLTLVVVLLVAAALRLSFGMPGVWQEPWTPHHFDEHVLPYEALALWEGVTPREVGWPASPFRLVLSAAYVGPLLADRRQALAAADDAGATMGLVAQWVGEQASSGERLYAIGRVASAVIGVLHVLATMLAARAWLGPASMPLAGALVAVSPLAVSHSQLVLSDVSGACLATLLLALVPRTTSHASLAPWLGVVAGLAAASKFHFGIWLLVAVTALWTTRSEGDAARGSRLTPTLVVLAAFGLTLVAFVPWLWTNPPLGLKEFAGVVLVKAGDGARGLGAFATNAWTVLGGLGLPLLLGAVAGVRPLVRESRGAGLATLAVTLVALLVLSGSAVVFGRYGLVLLPGLSLAAAAGWMSVARRWPRLSPGAAVAAILLLGLPQSIGAIDEFRVVNSYHAAHAWMTDRLPEGAMVVVHSEDNQYLPRTEAQLAECAAYAGTESAYREKWATNRVTVAPDSGMPMRLAILNDELYHAYWCGRERLAVKSPAFVVRRFHHERRFQTMSVPALRDEFRAGLADPSRGFDAVLVHWDLFPDLTPAMTFNAGPGPLLRLYLRPGLVLRPQPRS